MPLVMFASCCVLFMIIGNFLLEEKMVHYRTLGYDTGDHLTQPPPREVDVVIAQKFVNMGMQVVASLVMGAASLFIILSQKYQPRDKHWTYGTIGLIAGFWLK